MEELKYYINKSVKHSLNQPLFDLSPVRIKAAFLEFQRKINMEPVIPLHCLRHSHASMLIDMGFGADVVGDRLGHKDASMVMMVYGHLYAERREEVVNKIDSMMRTKK
jgi:integrase